MPEQYQLQPTPIPPMPVEPQKNARFKQVLLIGIPSLFIVFFLGLLFGRLTAPTPKTAAVITPTPTPAGIAKAPQITPAPTIVSEVPSIDFLPNKQYFDDTFVVVAKDSPHQTIILSVSRIEQARNFSEYTKVNYFDGKTWDRKITTTSIATNQVTINPLLRSWNPSSSITPTNLLQLASVQLPTKNLSFSSTNLQNEISIQSTPGSTKFIYQGEGTFTIGQDTYPANVFYSRTYSFNASDLAYLTKPNTLISDWLLFWDKEGTFYYVDGHRSSNNDASYVTPFLIGLEEDAKRSVAKTNSITIGFENKSSVPSYHTDFISPMTEEVFLPLTNSLNKSDNKSYSWITAVGEGSVVKKEGRSVSGVGLVEYIRKN